MKLNISHQNKDLVSKVVADTLKGKSMETYGLLEIIIREVLPTNLR